MGYLNSVFAASSHDWADDAPVSGGGLRDVQASNATYGSWIRPLNTTALETGGRLRTSDPSRPRNEAETPLSIHFVSSPQEIKLIIKDIINEWAYTRCQNEKFSYGYASSPGKRSSMEDFYETRIDGVDGEIVGLFGVFDGHGGARAAEYVKHNLFSNLIRHPKFISDTKSAIADAYSHTDSEFLKSENNQNKDAGSTASTAILVGDRLLVANVGDSRAVICRGGSAIAVSRDHKPDQTDERRRIEDAGGFVMWAGTWRVGGVLAVSRAFGDRLLKQYVVADPEIQEEKVDSSLEFLILASDGLWDVVTNEEAVAMVKPMEEPEEAAKRLMQEAYQRGSGDNITIVVVRFLFNQTLSSLSSST